MHLPEPWLAVRLCQQWDLLRRMYGCESWTVKKAEC